MSAISEQVATFFRYIGMDDVISGNSFTHPTFGMYHINTIVNSMVALGWMKTKSLKDSVTTIPDSERESHAIPRVAKEHGRMGEVDVDAITTQLFYIVRSTRAGYSYSQALTLLRAGVPLETVLDAAGSDIDVDLLLSLSN